MKLCLVTHQFLPDNRAGVETVVFRAARALMGAGHDVLVYTSRKDLTRAEGRVFDDEYEGIPVKRVIRNLFHDEFRTSFVDPIAEQAFMATVLEGYKPDLVHFHHLMHHSALLPRLCKEHGIPVVQTLHDYWFECPRYGTLRSYDGRICEKVDTARCSRCLQAFSWRNPKRLAPVHSLLKLLRNVTGIDAQAPLQKLYRKLSTRMDITVSGEHTEEPDYDGALEAMVKERRTLLVTEFSEHVDRILCPSEFLRARAVAMGLPADRVSVQCFGVPRPGDSWSPVPRQGPLRFGFLGSVLPHKGVDLLVEAFAALVEDLGPDRIALQVHGSWSSNPSYGERIRDLGHECGARVTGPFVPGEVDALLAEIDVLVVPSIWFENSPVTIHDARVRGIPILASDIGALRELVPDPARRFQTGDLKDLMRVMASCVENPPPRNPEEPDGPLAPTPEEDLEKTLKLYRDLTR